MKSLFFVVLLFPFLAMAAPGYGVVTLIKGKVEAVNAAGEKRTLKVGDKVFESESIVTQKMSAARLAMMDTNVIEVYPNSSMKIQQYLYNPKEDQKNVNLEVIQGRIKSTVKQKYDNDKNKYNVKTPVIVAGVRGTTFSAEHDRGSASSRVVTFEGNVLVGKRGADDTVREFFAVKANQSVNVDSKPESKPEVKEVPKVEQEKIKQEEKKEGFEKPAAAAAPEERAKVMEARDNKPAEAAPATTATTERKAEPITAAGGDKPALQATVEEKRREVLEQKVQERKVEEAIRAPVVVATPTPTSPAIDTKCPTGTIGRPPNCTSANVDVGNCPAGTTGVYPNCSTTATCASGGTWPNCTTAPTNICYPAGCTQGVDNPCYCQTH